MTEKKKDLNKKELLKYHKSFPISVFEEDLSIKKRILVLVINIQIWIISPVIFINLSKFSRVNGAFNFTFKIWAKHDLKKILAI